VLQLNGISYTRVDLSDKERVHLGFAAQQVEEVLPELVTTHEDEMKTKSVNYAQMTAVLAEAVKEQQEQIEAQDTKINAQQEIIDKQQTLLEDLLKRVQELENK